MSAAITKIGGAGSVTTAQTTIVASLTAGVNVGEMAFIVGSIGSGKVATSCVDSKSNTWNLIAQPTAGTTSASCNVYYTVCTTALTTSDTITMSWSGTVARRAWTVGKVTGLVASPLPLDLSSTASVTAATSASLTTSPSSTAQPNEIVVVCYGSHQTTTTTSTFTADGAYAALDTENGGNGTTNEVCTFVESKIVSSTGVQTGAPTVNHSSDIAAVIFTMKILGVRAPIQVARPIPGTMLTTARYPMTGWR